EHPDTGNKISGITIPGWDFLLEIAAGSSEMTNLGYQGVDIVLDEDLGPLVLELNARPGLGIQIANNAGLLHRLRLVEEHRESLASRRERTEFAKEHFGVGAAGTL
ncbi:MAG: sugar-transfer associated ATP-grasp domain-containing protein, partial [Pseudomonadota bacterium]